MDKTHRYRRIDLKVYPLNQYGAAVTYFTGSQAFNIQMRNHAIKLGYSLTDHGLLKLDKDGNPIKGKEIACPTEMDVFKLLKYEYKEPKDRDI